MTMMGAIKNKGNSKYFYQNLKDSGHPYLVRWFEAFVGTGLYDDIINIIASFAFYKRTFPMVKLYDEINFKGYYEEFSGNKVGMAAARAYYYGIVPYYSNDYDVFKRFIDKWGYTFESDFKKVSLPFLERLFLKDPKTIFEWINNFACKSVHNCFDYPTGNCWRDMNGDFSSIRFETLATYINNFVQQKYFVDKKIKIQNIARRLSTPNSHFDYRVRDIFLKRWKTKDGRKKPKTDADVYFYNGDNKMFYPRYIDSEYHQTKSETLSMIKKEVECGNMNVNLKSLNGKSAKFLRWVLMTEGSKIDDYNELKIAIKKCDVAIIKKYQHLSHLF